MKPFSFLPLLQLEETSQSTLNPTMFDRVGDSDSVPPADVRGFLVTEIIVRQKLLQGQSAIETSIMAKLSAAQVSSCT